MMPVYKKRRFGGGGGGTREGVVVVVVGRGRGEVGYEPPIREVRLSEGGKRKLAATSQAD